MRFFDSVDSLEDETKKKPKGAWQNWSGNQTSHPARVFKPVSTSELAAEFVSPNGGYRVVGSGHSCSSLAKTSDTLISLNQMTGLLGYDLTQNTARLAAGTAFHQIGELLDDIGQTVTVWGDVSHQTLAGAIATGAHGSGSEVPCIAGCVKSLTLMTVTGKVIECSAHHNKALFDAARVNLGCFGVITEVELQNQPAYEFKECIEIRPLDDVLANLEQLKEASRHLELQVFAYSDEIVVKTMTPVPKAVSNVESHQEGSRNDDVANKISPDQKKWKLGCELTARVPSLVPFTQKKLQNAITPVERIRSASELLSSINHLPCNSMEYQIAEEHGPECLRAVIKEIRAKKLPLLFPIEYRYVARDEIWLSPFYRRHSASIAVNHYASQEYLELFKAIEPVFDRFQGRPHWGKVHTKDHHQFAELYPKWEEWLDLRDKLDPKGLLLSPEVKRMFGLV